MGIGPADVMTLLLGFAVIALLIVSAFLVLYWVVRKAVAAEIRVARGGDDVVKEGTEDRP